MRLKDSARGAFRRSSADRIEPAGGRPPRRRGALAPAGRPRRARRARKRQPVVAQALDAIRADAPTSMRICAPPLRARWRGGRCRSACSNISSPTGWRSRRRCLPRRRSSRPSGERLLRVADEETRQFIEALHPEVATAAPHRREPSRRAGAGRTHRVSRRPADATPSRPRRLAAARSSRGSSAAAAAARQRDVAASRRSPAEGAVAVPLGMRAERRDRLGRGRAARRADRTFDRARRGRRRRRRRRGGGPRLRPARAVPRCRADASPARGSSRARGRSAALPAFDPTDGRFAGYRGIALREFGAAGARARRALDVARRSGFAARAGPRDQDSAQRDHRLRRDHRGPVSRPRRPPLSRARRRDRRRRRGCW